MDLLFKYPTRGRPELFQEIIRIYLSSLSHKHPYRFVISCDTDDETMNNDPMREWISRQPRCEVFFNDPPQTKVSAINANVAEQNFALLVLVSDDMVPQVDGFDDRIADLFDQFFPDGDGVLHLNDGRVGQQLNTLPIMGRPYYDRFGYIYAPCYASTHCDNEFHEVSERLGRAVYVNECIIRHNWIGEYAPDHLHHHNEKMGQKDGRIFQARRQAGFP